MSNQKRKVTSWFISCAMLASLLCAGYVAAQDKDKPQPPIKRGAETIISIFDDRAAEFEESTYTPPPGLEEKLYDLKLPKDLRKYLNGKYPGVKGINDKTTTLEQTEWGPAGKLHMSNVTPKGGWGSEIEGIENRAERARAIAMAFIADEAASIFSTTDITEFRETKFLPDEYGHYHILYTRYVGNLPLENTSIYIHLQNGESIQSLTATVASPSPALYEAASKKTIGRGKVFKVVRDSLKSEDPEVSVAVKKAEKHAVIAPPYVIWYVEATSFKPVNGGIYDWQWEFKIDAFTGEIIQKRKKPLL